jgi:DNA-binding transcriptional LysR family regulator
MHETNLRTIDLNLLVALHALLEEKHVSRAAERISLSQPAMSRALARLRETFQDPLLVKGIGGMTLTVRAIDLYHPLQKILCDIRNIVTTPSIDPSAMQGEVVIATRDYELAAVLPKIINRITLEAPDLKITVVPLLGDDLSPLDKQIVDFVIAGTDKTSATLHRHVLYQESFVCLLSKKNPAAEQAIDLATFTKMKHCLVSISNFGLGYLDVLLAKINLKRNVVVRIPHFLATAHIVAHSDLVVTLPRRLGELLSKQEEIALVNVPLEIPDFPIFLYWHTRNQNNPIHTWVKKVIRDNC